MALLRDADGFNALFAIASLDLGDPAAFLEKDYWVTQVLRALNTVAPGGLVLKGGTSLSKGCRIINRFSEDVGVTAGKRGYNPVNWGVFSLFASPVVGVILLALVTPRPGRS